MGFQDVGHGTHGCLECGKQINGALKKNCSADMDLCHSCHKEYMVFKHVRLFMPRIWAELSRVPSHCWNRALRKLLPPEEYEELYALAIAPRRAKGANMTHKEIAADARSLKVTRSKLPHTPQRSRKISKVAFGKLRESGRLFRLYRELHGFLNCGGLRA